jgi:methanol--5-hydroxybenzimidazolylcobamide Co-methyltransferase
MAAHFERLAYSDPSDLVFGVSEHPLHYGLDLKVGAGRVVPELKYAPRPGTEASVEKLKSEYRDITRDALDRAVNLGLPALQLETEYVAQMTYNPSWGEEVLRVQKEIMQKYHDEYGIACALRATIGDVRTPEDGLREGRHYQQVIESFERAVKYADLLSIESTGGKEVFNHAIIRSDVKGVVFGVAVLGCLDMSFLWDQVVAIAQKEKVVPAGDTDCAHSNTAMQLAGGLLGRELPHTMAATVRALGASRSLVAYERGATGPGKDCGFENVILKAITGYPMSFEGKSSACADSTLMGNIPAAACDLWSNESVQQGELFGGTNPQVFTEILGYDCALFNAASSLGVRKQLVDALVASDKFRDPQPLVLAPENACAIGASIVKDSGSYYRRGLYAALKAVEIIQSAHSSGHLKLNDLESKFLEKLAGELRALPDGEGPFIEKMIETYANSSAHFVGRNYGL